MLNILAHLSDATSFAVDASRARIIFAQADGRLGSVAIAGGRPSAHQRLASPATGLDASGRLIVLATDSGGVSTLDPRDLGAAPTEVARLEAGLGQAIVSGADDPTVGVVTRRRGRPPLRRAATGLALVRVATGAVKTRPIRGLSGVALAGRTVYVGINRTRPAGGEVAVLRGSATRTLAAGLPPVGRIGVASDGAVLLACHPASGELSQIEPATGTRRTVTVSALPGALVEARGLADGRIIVLTSDVVAIADKLDDLVGGPTIAPLSEPVFVGSWTPLSFDLGGSGLSKDDVRFVVPDGPDAGFVSYARPDGVGDPVPLLVVGGAVGLHKVQLVETATSAVLADTEFEITDHWRDPDAGPPGFYAASSSFDEGAWGGGPATPQNLNVHPHTGTWNSLVLMVDTSSGRWPTDAPTMNGNRADILGHITNGVLFNGVQRSTRTYYEENSSYVAPSGATPAQGLTLGVHNNQTYGPVNLPGSWTDYFAQTTDPSGAVIDDRWFCSGGTVQTIISRSISDGITTAADFAGIDVLIIVPFSAAAAPGPGAQFVFSHTFDAQGYLAGTNAVTDRRVFACSVVPLDFAVFDAGNREMHTTLSHELGHSLELPDLYDFDEYSDDISDRLTSDWDMMAGSRNTLPHFTVSNKMRMGWIEAGHVHLFNFLGSGAVDEQVTLHAAELGDPPAGRVKAIEIRLGDGWNYYLEYRAEQPGMVSDDLVVDRRVVITDVISDSFAPPIARPTIVFVREDIDGDGPLLDVGLDLEEKDPGTGMDMKVEVVSTAADNAVVRVTYGCNGKPEPGIRPWSDGPDWQSPDIEIRNARTAADPARYFNIPWLGHDNTIVAKVKNSGDLLATGVVVDFFVTEYSSGDGPWVPLPPPDTRDIAAGDTVEFSTLWNPATEGHYCVIARIRLYQDPANPAVVDQNIYNNEARSNYTRFVSASGSPSSRVGASVLLANPYRDSTHVYAVVKQTHPEHRVFTSHQWLRVPGNEALPIQVWDEALWGTPEWDLQAGREQDPTYLWEVPNRVSVAGWAVRPFRAECGALTLTGGVGMRVDAGRATKTELLQAGRGYVAGRVEHVDDGTGVPSGTVLIEVRSRDEKYFTVTDTLRPDGTFSREFDNELGDDAAWVEVHFLGAYGAAPSTTGRRPLR